MIYFRYNLSFISMVHISIVHALNEKNSSINVDDRIKVTIVSYPGEFY